jgi:hypothetical protein
VCSALWARRIDRRTRSNHGVRAMRLLEMWRGIAGV